MGLSATFMPDSIVHHQLRLLHDDRDFDPMVKFLGLETIAT